ncbi:MAG TPA: alpha/beta hydrolase [Chitinophaga sp.]|uniref:alpha/beta fold hydrolase n=1 Tax=Chitinophaga sp. TaxID=1869181 RepID=UPI002F95CC54
MKTVLLLLAIVLLAHPLHAQQMDSLQYAQGYLYYHTYGTGTPVIILSGGPGNSYLQQEEVAITLSRSYKSILLEQRGTGRSIPTPFDSTTITLQAEVEDVKRLLDHLHIQQGIIYGHSWGAMLAMCFAAAYPERVRTLVLANPGYYKISEENFAVHVANLRVRLGLTDLQLLDSLTTKVSGGRAGAADSLELDKLGRLSYIYNKSMLDSMLKKINAGKPNIKMRQLLIQDLFRVHYDVSKTLPRYKGPVHVIAGRQDALAFYTYDLKIIRPSIQLHWIQESGHFPMFEQAKPFYDTLFTVLKTVR